MSQKPYLMKKNNFTKTNELAICIKYNMLVTELQILQKLKVP